MSEQLHTELSDKLYKVLAGKDLILSIWDHEANEILAVAGQQGLTINRDKDTIEVSAKDSGSWKQFIVGTKEWSIDNDGVYVPNDDSHKRLSEMFNGDEPILIKVTNQKTKTDLFAGMAVLTSYPLEAPYDDAVTYTIALQGTGELVDLTLDTEPVGAQSETEITPEF